MIYSAYVRKQITKERWMDGSVAKLILEFDVKVRSSPTIFLSFCFTKNLEIEFYCLHTLST